KQRGGEPPQRFLLRLRGERASRDKRGRQPLAALGLAAAERDRAGDVVERRHRPAGAVFVRVFASLALVEVVLLGRERERPLERVLRRDRLVAVVLETAERL